jgi:hypothetical protein
MIMVPSSGIRYCYFLHIKCDDYSCLMKPCGKFQMQTNGYVAMTRFLKLDPRSDSDTFSAINIMVTTPLFDLLELSSVTSSATDVMVISPQLSQQRLVYIAHLIPYSFECDSSSNTPIHERMYFVLSVCLLRV